MKYILTLLLLISSAPAAAQVTCKENVMTTNRFCSSKAEMAGNNFYFFATDDTGAEPLLLFNFGGLTSSSRPDGIMIKLDDAPPFKAVASSTRSDVNCRGYGGCKWSVGASAKISSTQFKQISAASRMLVSFTEGKYVSEPIEVNPNKIGSWFEQWTTMKNVVPADQGAPRE